MKRALQRLNEELLKHDPRDFLSFAIGWFSHERPTASRAMLQCITAYLEHKKRGAVVQEERLSLSQLEGVEQERNRAAGKFAAIVSMEVDQLIENLDRIPPSELPIVAGNVLGKIAGGKP